MTIFEKIITREIPSHIVYEDNECIVILDIAPHYRGQVLVIPKVATDYLFDVTDPLYTHLFLVAQKMAKVLDKAFGALRTCMVIEGFEVPHAHIKLYPLTSPEFILKNVLTVTDDDLKQDAEKIRAVLSQ